MKISSFSNIAIIQTAFLGDVALALFFAQELRALNPQARIHVVTTPQAAELVRRARAVDNVIVYDKRSADAGISGILRLSSELRNNNCDCVFGLQRSIRTSLVARLSGATCTIGFSNATASLLYQHRLPWEIKQHEVERNHSLLQPFEEYQGSVIPTNVELQLAESPLPRTTSVTTQVQPRVVIAPGSVWATKRWGRDSFTMLAASLLASGYDVVLIGSQDDAELCNDIANQSGARSLAGSLSLSQTVALMRDSELVVCNDSAPTHLAALAGTRTVTIFGSTVPAFGFAPRGADDVVIENQELACRPCGLHGKKECPLGTMECMTSISSQRVLDAIGVRS